MTTGPRLVVTATEALMPLPGLSLAGTRCQVWFGKSGRPELLYAVLCDGRSCRHIPCADVAVHYWVLGHEHLLVQDGRDGTGSGDLHANAHGVHTRGGVFDDRMVRGCAARGTGAKIGPIDGGRGRGDGHRPVVSCRLGRLRNPAHGRETMTFPKTYPTYDSTEIASTGFCSVLV